MAQTSDQYLWFGTFGGLVRFDGVTFTVFDPDNTPQLPSRGIVNLHADRRGRLWISTLEGLVVLDDAHWLDFSEDPALGDEPSYIRSFAERENGDLLLTTFNGRIVAFTGGTLVQLPLIYPIIAADGAIDLAAGIDPFAGQQALSADADLAHLVFQANSTIDVARIRFRVSEPSTRVSTPDGPLAPALQNSPAFLLRPCASCLWSDLNCDDVGDLADFHVFGNCMHGPDVPVSDACVPADLNDDMDVDLHDFAEFQRFFAGGQP